MPSVDDWLGNPLAVIDRLFEENKALGKENQDNVSRIRQYFEKHLDSVESRMLVPSLNDVPLHNLKTNSLVKFRCMVQDMHDPEYYLGRYEVEDVKLGEKTIHTGMWKDLAECGCHQTVVVDSPNNKTMERQTLYCVPIPGESNWTKKTFASDLPQNEMASTSTSNRLKRPHDDEDEKINGTSSNTNPTGEQGMMEMDETMETENKIDNKKSKATKRSNEKKQPSLDLNFPLPGEKGPACLVKLYDNDNVDGYKVNDMVEFIGILSNDPAMVDFPEDKRNPAQSAFIDPNDMVMDVAEQQAHHPPPSLVPRLHVVLTKKLSHSHPLLPGNIEENVKSEEINEVLTKAVETRGKMMQLLKEALYGDELAAEYVLCHLISSVYARHDVIALGKYSLNLQGCPRDTRFATHVYKLLEFLLPKTHLLPLTVLNLNNTKFSPRKDYSANRLTSGVLQLSDNTQIVVDETAMQPGQLDANGVRNLTAVGNVIMWQKVEYDFNYHKQDFPTNLQILVMSEGKSLLKCDCAFTLSQQTTVNNMDEHFDRLFQSLSPEVFHELRSYLGLVQLLPYSLPESVQKEIENDFVEIRKECPENMSVDDFHSLLVLARLVSLSNGLMTLNKECWEKTKELENQRKQRMKTSETS